jgi:hypothetical protein
VEGGVVRRLRAVALLSIIAAAACGGQAPPAGSQAPVPSPTREARPINQAPTSGLIPPGLGTLRQDDISIVLETGGVRISALPLDESVIRTLRPDSYRALHLYAEDNRTRVAQRATMRGIREPRVWYVQFDGLAPDARFVWNDITVTSGGRDFRPVDVVPLTSGFAEERLQPRERQRGLLIFEDAVDASQPLAVSVGTVRNVDWDLGGGGILQKLDTERASIRGRASAQPAQKP